MEKIASFTIDHLKLLPGIYVSRKDNVGDSMVKVLPEPVTPSNVCSRRPQLTPFTRPSMASGWSPEGR